MLIHHRLKESQDFSDIEKTIASYILEKQTMIEKESARYIASQVYTAPSTVVRFCQKIGFNGFNEFKEAYLNEIHYLSSHFHDIDPNTPFNSHDKNVVLASKMGQLYKEIIDDTLTLIHHDTLQKSIGLLNQATTIYVCSSGVQSDVAQSFKDKLLKIGKSVDIFPRLDEAFSRACFCDKKSVFILISYSGETESLLKVAKKLKEREIPSISITTFGENSLSHLVSNVLYVSTREKITFNLGNFSMSISTLFLLDVLYAGIFNYDYSTHFHRRVQVSSEFQTSRTSSNPLLKDQEDM